MVIFRIQSGLENYPEHAKNLGVVVDLCAVIEKLASTEPIFCVILFSSRFSATRYFSLFYSAGLIASCSKPHARQFFPVCLFARRSFSDGRPFDRFILFIDKRSRTCVLLAKLVLRFVCIAGLDITPLKIVLRELNSTVNTG